MPRRFLAAAILAVPVALGAQQPTVPATLSLADALAIARDNNPAYRQVLNDRGPAALNTRGAYASLFLPSVTATGGMGYTGVGEQVFLTSSFSQSASSMSSYYTLQLDYLLSSATLTAPGAARAEQRAVDSDVEGARRRLEFDVTTQYLTVLQATENERVAGRLGGGALVGDAVWDRQAKVRLRLGPLPRARYQEFLPGGTAHEELRQLTRFYGGEALEFGVQLVLAIPHPGVGGSDQTGNLADLLVEQIGRQSVGLLDGDR